MVYLSTSFQLVLIAVTAITFAVTAFLIIKKHMRIKYALVWFFLSAMLLLLAIFPQLVQNIAQFLHIYSDTNAIFLIMIAILYMLSFSFSIIFSRNSQRIKDLTQAMAIMEAKMNELEKDEKK